MNRIPLAIAAVFAASLLGFAPAALAQQGGTDDQQPQLTVEEKKRLKKIIESARKAYQAENYESSVEKLRKAYELYPNPAFFYRIGLAEQHAGDYDAAIDAFDQYLEQKPDSPKKKEVEQRLAKLRKKAQDSQHDEQKEGQQETAETSDSEDDKGQQQASAEDQASDEKSSETSTSSTGTDSGGGGSGRTIGYVLGGLGGAAAISAGTFTYLYFQSKNKLQNLRSSYRRTPETEAREVRLVEERNRRLTLTYASAGVAVAALGTAGFLLLRQSGNTGVREVPRSEGSPDFTLSVTPHGSGLHLNLRGRF